MSPTEMIYFDISIFFSFASPSLSRSVLKAFQETYNTLLSALVVFCILEEYAEKLLREFWHSVHISVYIIFYS